jgi:hypothetical protein
LYAALIPESCACESRTSRVLQIDAEGKERKGQESKQETERPQAGNRAAPATQADTEHSRGRRSRKRTQTNRNREKQQTPTAQSPASKAPQGQQHRHQTDTDVIGTRPRNKRKGTAPMHATEVPCKPQRQSPLSPGSKTEHVIPSHRGRQEGQQLPQRATPGR